MAAFIEAGMDLRRDDIELGRKLERRKILAVMKEVALENEIGSYCYITDVVSYLEDLAKNK